MQTSVISQKDQNIHDCLRENVITISVCVCVCVCWCVCLRVCVRFERRQMAICFNLINTIRMSLTN